MEGDTVGTVTKISDQPTPARPPAHGTTGPPPRGWFVLKLLTNVRVALWRAFVHDAFGVAKGGAFSAILTLFPALMIVGAIIATFERRAEYIREISGAAYQILPPSASAVVRAFFESTQGKSGRVLVAASLITLWTASGVMISWMVGVAEAFHPGNHDPGGRPQRD